MTLEFQQRGFIDIKQLIARQNAEFLSKVITHVEKKGKGRQDSFVIGSTYFYKEPIFETVMESLRDRIENICGLQLFKTYSYVRKYSLGEELKIHKDRPSCEITVSILLSFKNKSWPIWLMDKQANVQQFTLDAGDALIFKGIELSHWREANEYGECYQLFLHYVDQNGKYAMYKDDFKPVLRH